MDGQEANRERREKTGDVEAESRRPGKGALKRQVSGTAPTMAFRAEKSPTDKGWALSKWWCSSPLEETALPHRQGHHRRDCTPCGSPGRVLPSPHISATAERETTSALRWVACVFRPLVPEHESRCTPQGTAKLLPTSTATRSPHHPSIRDRPTRKLAKVSTEV